MSLLLNFVEKVKCGWLKKLLIGTLCILDFVCVIGFFVLPFIKYSEKFVVFAFILWSCSAILFCIAAFIMYKNDLRSDKKAIEEYQKDKVVYTVGRFGVLLYFVSMFCLVFLARNDLVKVSLFGIIGIAILGLLLLGVIITLLTQYKNNYLKMAKDTFRVLYVFFAVIFFSVVMLSGIMVYGNDNYPAYVSQFLVGISAIPLLLGGIYLVCKMFLSNKMLNEKSDGLPISIILFIALGIITCILLRYVITDCKMQEIMTTIFASILGGAITLAGVAWTIKNSNETRIEDQHRSEIERKEDLQRIEDERKEDWQRIENQRREDERKKFRPIVHVFAGNYGGQKHDIDVMSWVKNNDNISRTPTSQLTIANIIHECYFGNTDFSNIYVWGIKINGHLTEFSSIRYIKKENYFLLNFSNQPLYTAKPIETLSLILEDMLENLYEVPLEFSYSQRFKWYAIQGNNPSFCIGDSKKERNNE
jgi:hypothetical protein